jgi:hypothetical protein
MTVVIPKYHTVGGHTTTQTLSPCSHMYPRYGTQIQVLLEVTLGLHPVLLLPVTVATYAKYVLCANCWSTSVVKLLM